MTNQSTTASGCKDSQIWVSRISRLSAATSFPNFSSILAKFAAALLVTASAGLGAVYAFNVGSEHGKVLAALFVLFAVGLEIAKPLSVVAAVKALGSWQLVRGAMLAILAMVAIAYSLSAELTLMAGTRGDVVAERQNVINSTATAEADATRARERYDSANTELTTLAPSRPVAEVQAEIDALLLTPGADECKAINGKVTRDVCPKVATLKIEKARADRRAELEAILTAPLPVIAATSNVHPQSSGKAVREADPGASALATYLAALGLTIPVKVLTDWLASVPVIALELGSALAGVLIQATEGQRRNTNGLPEPRQPRIEVVWNTTAQDLGKGVPKPSETGVPALPAPVQLAVCQEPRGSVPTWPRKVDEDDHEGDGPSNVARLGTALLGHLKEKGGKVRCGQRGLARLLGTSTTELNRTIHRLAAAGVLLVTADRMAGTTIELVAA